MNAVVQCLRGIPEFCKSLKKFRNTSGDMAGSLTLALRDTYEFMDKYKQSDYPPILLVQLLKTVFPHFATTGENGAPQQQDANECLTELLRIFQQKLDPSSTDSKKSNFIDEYMSGRFSCEMKCDESPDEPVVKSEENFLQLSCFISQDVKYLSTGLKLKLEEKLEKQSPSLGRNAMYTRMHRITRLPSYLCVQLVRFYYKEKERVSAKILKDIKFPLMLDCYDLCSKEFQEKLKPQRELFRLQDEEVAFQARAAKKKLDTQTGLGASVKPLSADQSKTDDSKVEYAPFSFENDIGSSNSGYYDLKAVLTHKGRSSSSGNNKI
jgi:ubiquitin carboxyl-terminal hydrolase 14